MNISKFLMILSLIFQIVPAQAEVPHEIAIRLRDDVYFRLSEVEKGMAPRRREDMYKEISDLLIFGNDERVRALDRAYMNEVKAIINRYVSAHNVMFAPEAELIRKISSELDDIREHSMRLGDSFPRNLVPRFQYIAGKHEMPYLGLFLNESIDRIKSLRKDADLSTVKRFVQEFSDFIERNQISCDAILRG